MVNERREVLVIDHDDARAPAGHVDQGVAVGWVEVGREGDHDGVHVLAAGLVCGEETAEGVGEGGVHATSWQVPAASRAALYPRTTTNRLLPSG